MSGDGSAEDPVRFHWSDYLVFILSLVISGSVGVIQGIVDAVRNKRNAGRPQTNAAKTATAGAERNISVWPASLSVMASTLAGPYVLGVPAEVCFFGVGFSFLALGYVVGIPIITHFFFTRFYDMEIASIYQYLEVRFNKVIRSLCTFIFAFSIIVYIGIIIYAPAVAFSQVTGLSMQISILGVGIIGVIYTTIGGLKGVAWVDAIQMLIILVCIIAIIIKGSVDVGGIGVVWQRAYEGRRTQFPQFSLDPTIRHSFWTQTIGGALMLIVLFTNQSIVQKFLGLQTRKKMIITSYGSVAIIGVTLLLFTFAGVVTFAYYYDCSPLASGKIKKPDQLLPVFVLEVFQGIYGFSGLFTATVFSASLSSMAGGINALALVTILDVLNPLYIRYTRNREMAPRTRLILFKSLVTVYGFITIGFAYMAPLLGAGLMQLALNLLAVVGTPMLSVFFMGIFMPCVNSWGAGFGLVISLVVNMWMSLAGLLVNHKYKLLFRSLMPFGKNCGATVAAAGDQLTTWLTTAFQMTTTVAPNTTIDAVGFVDNVVGNASVLNMTGPMMFGNPTSFEKFYTISYMWYYVTAMIVSIAVAFPVSFCTGFRRGEPVDKNLSYMCCYKEQEKLLITEQSGTVRYVQLKEDEKSGHVNMVPINGSPAAGQTTADVEPVDEGLEPFMDIDDTGVYNYGFVRDRCSRCRRSRVVHCTRF